MIAASAPVQRPENARLLVIDQLGNIRHVARSAFVDLLRPGDVVIANDAATLPASLSGLHDPTGAAIEVRLAGRASLHEMHTFSAVVFGAGDFHTRTEDRPLPPQLRPGDNLSLGPLQANVVSVFKRLISLEFKGTPQQIWEGLAHHGRPIQYAHIPEALKLWDTWTPIAGPPVAFEPPSAGFALDWSTLERMTARKVQFGTITHAAGISSTGDPELDALLPFDEAYDIPSSTAHLINAARGRVIAIGTTVVRALEHSAASHGGIVTPGEGVANQRLGPQSPLHVVDALLSGTHERGTSHYELLRAFTSDASLQLAERELNARDYRTHEFGDSVFLEAMWHALSRCPHSRTIRSGAGIPLPASSPSGPRVTVAP